jgi:hypothetical protein
VVWNSSVFQGVLQQIERFGLIVNFTSKHNNENWTLVCVYGPCQGIERDNFVSWLYNLPIPGWANWLLLERSTGHAEHQIPVTPLHVMQRVGTALGIAPGKLTKEQLEADPKGAKPTQGSNDK